MLIFSNISSIQYLVESICCPLPFCMVFCYCYCLTLICVWNNFIKPKGNLRFNSKSTNQDIENCKNQLITRHSYHNTLQSRTSSRLIYECRFDIHRTGDDSIMNQFWYNRTILFFSFDVRSFLHSSWECDLNRHILHLCLNLINLRISRAWTYERTKRRAKNDRCRHLNDRISGILWSKSCN